MILIPHGIHLFITFTFFISLVIYLVNVFVTNLLVQICDSLSWLWRYIISVYVFVLSIDYWPLPHPPFALRATELVETVLQSTSYVVPHSDLHAFADSFNETWGSYVMLRLFICVCNIADDAGFSTNRELRQLSILVCWWDENKHPRDTLIWLITVRQP